MFSLQSHTVCALIIINFCFFMYWAIVPVIALWTKTPNNYNCNNTTLYKINFFSHVKSITKQGQLPPKLSLQSKTASSDPEKASLFNEYFYSVYSPASPNTIHTTDATTPAVCLTQIEISVHDTFAILSALNPSKAIGIDGIGPKLLKACAAPLCVPLQHLFNLSLKYATLPDEWKVHKITPIHKSGDKSSVRNYRPISLLCSTSKVLEKLIYKVVMEFLLSSFSKSQFGFLAGRSTLQQLLLFLADIHQNREKKATTNVIYLDFQKAFDTVPHHILLQKLWSIGIRGCLSHWFQSYLSSRVQTVSINHHLSNYLPVLSGVPQGSLLGPLLFLVFINDLPSYVHSAKMLLFADDAKCYTAASSPSLLQKDIDSLYQWSLSNISFNTSKSSHLQFSHTSTPSFDLFLNHQPIHQCSSQKDLGVFFSNDLSWSSHYSFIVSKSLKTLGLIRRTVGTLSSTSVRKQLYIILIRSQLTYCSQIWRPHLIKDIALIESVQRRATKWILNDYSSDYRSRLVTLELLPLMMTYEINDVVFFMKSVQSRNPSFDILQHVSFSSSCTRSNGRKLSHSYTKQNLSRHFYFNRLPRLWNKLIDQANILDCSLTSAKRRLVDLMWQTFLDKFQSSNFCTFHFLCPCSRCIE